MPLPPSMRTFVIHMFSAIPLTTRGNHLASMTVAWLKHNIVLATMSDSSFDEDVEAHTDSMPHWNQVLKLGNDAIRYR